MLKIHAQGKDISIMQVGNNVYMSLTDIIKGEEGTDHIKNWMRNRNTVEFLGLWESLNNPNFKGVEFDTFRKEAGLNSFTLTPKKWVDSTDAIGIVSKAGQNGGTFAHKDIALEFCTWLSPLFKLLILKEFQRLKEAEAIQGKWDIRRFIAKASYKIQTDAIKAHLLPARNMPKDKEGIVYAEEAELLNYALFGMTSKEWREKNTKAVLEGLNLRDYADTHQLIVLSHLESLNASMIKQGIPPKERFIYLRDTAVDQLNSLKSSNADETLRLDSPHVASEKTTESVFNQSLKGLLNVPPPQKNK